MKTLFLVRHGKSSWHYPELDDLERPLKNRGENDAILMAKLLHKKNIKAGTIISSPAKRALDTAQIFAQELNYKVAVMTDERLYMKGPDSIMKVINQATETANLFIFSHNPDVLDIANSIAGNQYENVPTCGIVCIEFDAKTWKEAQISNASIKFFDYPSQYK